MRAGAEVALLAEQALKLSDRHRLCTMLEVSED